MKTFASTTFAVLFAFSGSGQKCCAEPLWSDVCTDDETKNLPFCDMSLDLDKRILDYVNRVPIETKISMMGHDASGYEALKIPPYMWWSEGLHGPLEPCVQYKDRCVCPTNFPSPSAMGNSFNRTLYRMVGHVIGIQGRAISNLRVHNQDIGDGLTYWSPTINMQRDPRWGRNQEVPGEDPFLTGQYSKAFVQALQGTAFKDSESERSNVASVVGGDDGRSDLKMAACCKHFLGNSLEHWGTYDRHSFNAVIDDYDLNNYYLPPFEECTKHAVGVMCSYNAVNGEPACASNWLLKDVLRKRMNFTGYLVTDCGALNSIVHGHHFAIDNVQASAMAKSASVDVNCGSVFQDNLFTAYNEGRVDEPNISDSFKRMARIQFRLGLFDSIKKSAVNPDVDISSIDSPQHQQLALEAAMQSIVLLQNKNSLLPMDKHDKKSLAIIGPHINAREALMGNYHGAKCGPLEAIMKKMKYPDEVKSMMGCSVTGGSISDIEKAVELARNSDTVILLLGLDQSQESEGHDRDETILPGLQPKLMEGILDAAGGKTIIVLIHGGTVSLGDEKDKASAILSAGYGGQAGSSAIANVLFGEYNPTGKLAATVYPPSFVDELPLTEMGLRVGVGRTYMYYTGKAEFSFGYGLSYSKWKLDWVNDCGDNESKDRTLPSLKLHEFMSSRIHIRVENLGPHATGSSQTILLFWYPQNGIEDDKRMNDFVMLNEEKRRKLRRKLINFQGTNFLLPGEYQTLEFELTWKDFAMWNSRSNSFAVSPGNYELIVQVSDTILKRPFEIVTSDSQGEFSTLIHSQKVS
eukprot:jgi/Psemu1/228775/e_gw1.2471.6.1